MNKKNIVNASILIITLIHNCFCIAKRIEKPIVVVIPSYNNEKWVENNLTSVFTQKYKNYKVVYVDDCSTDNTYKRVLELIGTFHQQERVAVIHNKIRCGAMANWYKAIHMCDDNAIIVQLDGDDWLAHDEVFAYLNKIYSESDIWMTYGQFMEYPTGIKHYSYSKKFDEQVIQNNSFRKVEQLPMSHLRTCYAWLFKSIKLEDVLYQGNFYPMTCDKVILACCVEMAARHHYCVPEILYVYNGTNNISDHKVNWEFQRSLAWYILSLPPYKQLDTPKAVDKLDDLDTVSLIFLCQDRPSEKFINNINKHKNQYGAIFVLIPEGLEHQVNTFASSIAFVPYTQSDFAQQIQYCLQHIKGRYVRLGMQEDRLDIDTTLCAKLLKATQVDVLFYAKNNLHQFIQDKNLPKISFEYVAYALYPVHFNMEEMLHGTPTIWRREVLIEAHSEGVSHSILELINSQNKYMHKNNVLCLLYNSTCLKKRARE
jgi:glycosyltransferase involved in cell wall biosynthesis